jgi:uncharacterized repeat protein (TIGR01451 family)
LSFFEEIPVNKNLRRLRIALFVPIIASAVGCGAVRGLACRICHRHDNECEPCAMNVSYSPGEVVEVGQPIVIGTTPVMPTPGVIVTPAPALPPTMVAPPPSMKPVPEEPETELTPMPPVPPRLDSPPSLPAPPAAKPGALSLKVDGSKGVVAAGEEVTFEVKLENTGESPVSQVRMRANFSGNLRPKSVSPEGTAEIQGNSVVFQMINPFMPMAMSYQITAEVIEDGATGKVTVEVESPILMGDPLREEVTTRTAAP